MASIPGKSCGPCTMCCKVLWIEELNKEPGPLCKHCTTSKGCSIYLRRPQVCRDYECEWLQEREYGPKLRPDLTGTILQIDPDSDEFQAVVDPETPMAWRKNELVFKTLVAKAKAGHKVIAKCGIKSWQIHKNGTFTPYG